MRPPSSCPVFSTKFEIDDKGKCIFVDADDPKLPINGTICKGCGLVQDEASEACPHCVKKLDPTHQ